MKIFHGEYGVLRSEQKMRKYKRKKNQNAGELHCAAARGFRTMLILVLLSGLLGEAVVAQGGFEEEVSELNADAVDLYNENLFEEAIEVTKRSLDLARKHLGEDHPETDTALSNLAYANDAQGRVYLEQGEFEKAEQLIEQALAIREKQSGPDHPDTASSLSLLAYCYDVQANYAEAESLYKRALTIFEERLGPEHSETAGVLWDLGFHYREQGKFKEAESFFLRELGIAEKNFGPDSPGTATSLYNLAECYREQEKYEEAEPRYERVLEIRNEQFGTRDPETLSSIDNLVSCYQMQGKFEKAELLYKQVIAILEVEQGKDHPDTEDLLFKLADFYFDEGKYDKAEPLFERKLDVFRSVYGEDTFDTAGVQLRLGQVYYELDKFEESGPMYERALAFFIERYGEDHVIVAKTLNDQGLLYAAKESYGEAERMYERALAIQEEKLGADDPDTIDSAYNLADCFFAQEKYAEAEPLFERVLEFDLKQPDSDRITIAETQVKLAQCFRSQGKYEEAETLSKIVLTIREEQLGVDHPKTLLSRKDLAALYYDQGRFEEAELLYEQALTTANELGIENHSYYAVLLNGLGLVYASQGKYDKAEPLIRRALALTEETLGTDHPQLGTALGNFASMLYTLGKYEEAEPLLRRSLAIDEKQFGSNDLNTAVSLNNLATLCDSLGKYEEAELLFERALKIREEQLGGNHPDTAKSLSRLAGLLSFLERKDEAEPLFRRSLKIQEERLGEGHADTASTLNGLALLYSDQGREEEAESLYERALSIMEKQFGSDHPLTEKALSNLAMSYESQGKYEEAESIVERELESALVHYSRMLRYFTRQDCLVLQQKLTTQDAAGNSLSAKLMAQAQIWFKGAVGEAMSHRRVVEEGLRNGEEGRKLLSKRKKLSRDYHRAVLELGVKSQKSQGLKNQLDLLEKGIATLLKEDLNLSVDIVDVAAVKAAMPSGSILLESFRYNHVLSPYDMESRYASVVIRGSGDPIYLAHGKAEEIEKSIVEFRKIIADPANVARAEDFRRIEAVLWKTYLAPMGEYLQPGEEVIFSLDSQLHFVPFGMIRDADGVPFGQKYKVRYVTSGRDLVKEVTRNGDGKKSALVLGNPSYRDNKPLRALAETGEEAETELVATNLRSGMKNDAGSISLTPLPGTAREVASLKGKLENKGYTVTSLSQGEATEEALEQAIDGHDIVHLATHGFFLSEIERETDPLDRMQSTSDLDQQTPVIISDPMYRSGLALAGAQSTFNLWKEGQVPPPSKDGILLAAEANLLNLRGTDLVVLSACETASGEALDGEGVMGLRRAFASAGANSTIMTLWPVNDESTVEVMDAFYEKYLGGTHPAITLAEVQNELYAPFVEKYGEVEAIARLAPFVCMSLGRVE